MARWKYIAAVWGICLACAPTHRNRGGDPTKEEELADLRKRKVPKVKPTRSRPKPRPRRSSPKAEPKPAVRHFGPIASWLLEDLADQLGAEARPIENVKKLKRFFKKLDQLEETKTGVVRVVHLGDSHIAADYITRTIRDRLQERFGDGGRGFVVIDQRAPYGGRRLKRAGWRRERVVDRGGGGKPYGFSGQSLTSARRGASVKYVLKPNDNELGVYYHANRDGAGVKVYAERELIGQFNTKRKRARSLVARMEIPEHRLGGATPPTYLNLVASGPGVRLVGLSFESLQSGVIYDSIGPVGADANVYLNFEKRSLRSHLKAVRPDLVVLMVGGNDALMVRQGKRTLKEVRTHHIKLIKALKSFVPGADCLLFGPMDAGQRYPNGKIGTKAFLTEVRDLQQQLAKKMGCGFWDTQKSMGGNGSFGRWLAAGIMNEDMVHPRSKGGDLVGHLFAGALLDAYFQRK